MNNKEEEESILDISDNDLNQIPHGKLDLKEEKKIEKKLYEIETQKINQPQKNSQSKEITIQNDIIKEDIIPLHIKIFYGLPSFSKMASLILLNVNALIFYEQKGSSLLLISFFTALTRCIELFLKPIIAFGSDNSSFKLGRRKPFMLFGCAFYCIFLVAIFTPPNNNISIYFGIFYNLFFIADTIASVPYFGLGPELSTSSIEREKLYIYVYFFNYIGVLLTSISPIVIKKFIKNCDCDILCKYMKKSEEIAQCFNDCDSKCDILKSEKGLLYTCMFIGFLFVISMVILSSLVKEKKNIRNKIESSYIIPTLYRLLHNKPFIYLMIPYIFDVTITQIFATILPFYITYIINPRKTCEIKGKKQSSSSCDPSNWIGLTMGAFFISSLFCLFIWHFLSNKFGKKNCWRGYSAICVICFSLILIPGQGNNILLVIIGAIIAFPASGIYLNDAILTDCIDYDEFMTMKRNESIYAVFQVYIPKLVGIAAQSLPLAIMSFLNFVPSQNGIIFEQPKGVLEFIKYYFIGLPVVLALISFYLKSKYPINDKKMNLLSKKIVYQNQYLKDNGDNIVYYYVINPIFNTKQIQILPKTDLQKKTELLTLHFYDEEYLKYLSEGDLESIYNSKFIRLIILFIISGVCIIVDGITFKFLENQNLNIFPLFALILFSIALCAIILIYIQLNVLSDFMSGKQSYDKTFAKLYLYKLMLSRYEDKIEVGLKEEIEQLIDECRGKKKTN